MLNRIFTSLACIVLYKEMSVSLSYKVKRVKKIQFSLHVYARMTQYRDSIFIPLGSPARDPRELRAGQDFRKLVSRPLRRSRNVDQGYRRLKQYSALIFIVFR